MEIFIIAIIILVSFLLVLVILAQNPKGGLSSQFGGSGTSNIIGVKKTGDLLENITWSLAIGLFVLALSMNLVGEKVSQGYTSPNVERAREQSIIPPINLDANDGVGSTPQETPTTTNQSEDSGLDALTDEEDQ